MSILENARKIRAAIENMLVAADDKTASTASELFPTLKANGALISAGTRINYNGILKKATVDLWDRPEYSPENAPSLWVDIEYIDGYRIIPDIITVTTMFSKDECGWWNGVLYKSLVNANVYNPS